MSLYNDDDLVAPPWINAEFLGNVLAKYEKKDNVEIIEFNLSPAAMKGDHYASIMFRCQVKYRDGKNASSRHRSLIIKTMPFEKSTKSETLKQWSIFETEIEMYTVVLPKIEKMLAECGESTKLSAEIYYHSLEPHKVLIFEDLCEYGFGTVRGRLLAEDEIKAVYKKLAKLHAVSYKLGRSEDREVVTKFKEGTMNMSVPLMKDLMSNGVRNFIDLLASHEEFAIYVDKVKDMQGEMEQQCKELYSARSLNNASGDIFVLNHGDFHAKNMMFKFSPDNKVEDMIMVDYQLCCYAPSTIDLVGSQFTMFSPALRMKRHELMHYYFTEFIRILKKINYPGKLPKYAEFQMATLKYRHYTVYLLAVMLPFIVGVWSKSVDELKDFDSDKMLESPDMIAVNYNLPAYIEEVRKLLPILLYEGYLD